MEFIQFKRNIQPNTRETIDCMIDRPMKLKGILIDRENTQTFALYIDSTHYPRINMDRQQILFDQSIEVNERVSMVVNSERNTFSEQINITLMGEYL